MISVSELGSVQRCVFPMVIPTYNNPTYLNNTVTFWKERGVSEFVIVDNGSTYPEMIKLLDSIDGVIISLPENPGPRAFYENKIIYSWLPEIFIATDPDLRYKKEITLSDIENLVQATWQYKLFKIGSRLNLDMEEESMVDKEYLWGGTPNTIRNLESMYYTNCIGIYNNEPLFSAPVDTTFAVYNKNHDNGFFSNNARIGGIYEVDHLGWCMEHPIPKEERAFYLDSVKNVRHASNEVIRRGESW